MAIQLINSASIGVRHSPPSNKEGWPLGRGGLVMKRDEDYKQHTKQQRAPTVIPIEAMQRSGIAERSNFLMER
jgi:hypothetical protein